MRKQKLTLLFFALTIVSAAYTQNNPLIIDYINTYKELAISEMKRTGVPAAIKLAQGIHETDAGTSKLVKKSNNHFGIKCKTGWTGMSVKHTDDARNECFRSYNESIDSYLDHSNFLRNSSRYASLFDLDPTDFSGWANGLKKAGYATNPRYPVILIKLIEDYHLQDYTLIVLGKLNPSEEFLVKNDLVSPENKSNDIADALFIEEKPVVMKPEPVVVVMANKKAKSEPVAPVVNEIVSEINPVYPDGEFKINETKVIYAKKGTSYLSIAEKHNLPLARLFEFNDMKVEEFVERDQLIYIMRKRKTGISDQYIVKEGDSLFGIAQAMAMRIESLVEYNYLKQGKMPPAGTVLYLKGKTPALPSITSGK
jgi:hypothetical protein